METEKISLHLLSSIKQVLSRIGLPEVVINQVDSLIYITIIIFTGYIAGALAHMASKNISKRIERRKGYALLSKAIEGGTLKRLSAIIPPIIIISLLPVAFTDKPRLMTFAENITWVYFTVMLVRSLTAILSNIGDTAENNNRFHNRPIKGFIQISKIIIYIVSVIVVVSMLTNKSPFYLIGGLGAFAAVLMLVFKDTITGFVGGILLLENDMMRLGDWIEIPGTAINGVVIDMSLTIVKIKNFDNTIATIPPYTLLSESFVNWRAMSESCGRRIMRGYTIKIDNIKPCSSEFIEKIKALTPEMKNFITATNNSSSDDGTSEEEQRYGTAETNLGLFRAYATFYLKRHPMLNKKMLTMVRTLAPTEYGIPLQIYCFTKDTEWSHYESIQSEIMEHLATALPLFELVPFQSSSSQDSMINGLVERGFPLERIKGIPTGTINDEFS
ncbi:MAG: mechanosensitive ion channel [Bacteroidaceae bacterium]|nr:mechanosensitive ion channel [Bacteroidaceae bacterium]MBR5276675.1 mechanosensitive ion channel [Bacteroidaceae bacterium]MBR5891874.1 mechanosensitive ion channel [Bacteroidaceae bacterium]